MISLAHNTCTVLYYPTQVPRPRLSASDWNLSIENTSLTDDGMYECQVNTDPKINYKIALTVKGKFIE